MACLDRVVIVSYMIDQAAEVAGLRAACQTHTEAKWIATTARATHPDAVVALDDAVVHILLPRYDADAAWGVIAAMIAEMPHETMTTTPANAQLPGTDADTALHGSTSTATGV
jgi:hypothetical protein